MQPPSVLPPKFTQTVSQFQCDGLNPSLWKRAGPLPACVGRGGCVDTAGRGGGAEKSSDLTGVKGPLSAPLSHQHVHMRWLSFLRRITRINVLYSLEMNSWNILKLLFPPSSSKLCQVLAHSQVFLTSHFSCFCNLYEPRTPKEQKQKKGNQYPCSFIIFPSTSNQDVEWLTSLSDFKRNLLWFCLKRFQNISCQTLNLKHVSK